MVDTEEDSKLPAKASNESEIEDTIAAKSVKPIDKTPQRLRDDQVGEVEFGEADDDIPFRSSVSRPIGNRNRIKTGQLPSIGQSQKQKQKLPSVPLVHQPTPLETEDHFIQRDELSPVWKATTSTKDVTVDVKYDMHDVHLLGIGITLEDIHHEITTPQATTASTAVSNNAVAILSIGENAPHRNDIRKGDIVVAVDRSSTAGLDYKQVRGKIEEAKDRVTSNTFISAKTQQMPSLTISYTKRNVKVFHATKGEDNSCPGDNKPITTADLPITDQLPVKENGIYVRLPDISDDERIKLDELAQQSSINLVQTLTHVNCSRIGYTGSPKKRMQSALGGSNIDFRTIFIPTDNNKRLELFWLYLMTLKGKREKTTTRDVFHLSTYDVVLINEASKYYEKNGILVVKVHVEWDGHPASHGETIDVDIKTFQDSNMYNAFVKDFGTGGVKKPMKSHQDLDYQTKRKAIFDINFDKLCKYMDENNGDSPHSGRDKLGSWYHNQRVQLAKMNPNDAYMRGKFNEKSIHLRTNDSYHEQLTKQLASYVERYGRSPRYYRNHPPEEDKVGKHELKLGRYLKGRQRYYKNKNDDQSDPNLAILKRCRLLEPPPSSNDTAWEAKYNELKTYKAKHSTNPPSDSKLYSFITNHRKMMRDENMTISRLRKLKPRIDKLNAIGFDWEPRKKKRRRDEPEQVEPSSKEDEEEGETNTEDEGTANAEEEERMATRGAI